MNTATRGDGRRYSIGRVSAAAFALAVLAGPGAAQTTIRILAPASGSGNAFAELATAYSAANPGVTVQVERVPSGDPYAQALLTQLQAGSGADLIFTNGGWGAPESLMPMAEAGRLHDLSGRAFAAQYTDQIVPDFWHDGGLYGLPLSMLNVGLVYNVDLMASLGAEPPRTFEQLLALCPVARAAGLSALGLAGASPFYFLETVAVSTLYGAEPDWNDRRAAGEVTFAGSEGWVEALNRVQQLAAADCLQPGVEAATPPMMFAEIAGGNALMSVSPTTMMGAVSGMNPNIRLTMVPFPGTTEADTVAIGFFNDALSVNASSANLEATLAFLDWLALPEQQQFYASVAGGVTPSDALAGNFTGRLEGMAPYFAAGRTASIPHHTWLNPRVRATLNSSGNGLFAGIKTPEQVLADLDSAW